MSYPTEIGAGKNKSKSTDGSLGKWNGESFAFHSSGAETEWLRQAYRQAVSPMTWQSARPADSKTDMMLKAMPEKAGTTHFKGPDGQFRVIGPEQREPKDVTEHRRQSVMPWLNTLPKKQQTTWQDLADLPEDHPHPGEAEQVAKWMGTYDSLKGEVPAVLVAEGPMPRPFRVATDVTPEEAIVGKPLADGGGRRGVVAGAGGLPPAPKQPTTQGEALVNVATAANDDILSAIPTLTDKLMKEPPVLNFNSMKTRPYPPTAVILDTTQPAPALGLNAEQMQNMSWVGLDQKLRAQDTYNPLFDSPPIRLQSLRSHARSPLAAAQEALDIVHETHLAKGRDWNQELPLHPEIAKSEFDNALEATVIEATTLWTGRKDSIPTALEIEQIRQYVAPRLVGYFPASMRDNLLKRDMPSSTLPEIKNGAQRIGDLMTALTFGEIKEITVDGQKIELSEIGVQPDTATESNKRPGSHGSLAVQRFNYLVGQEVQQMLRDCPEVVELAEVVNGPKTPKADGPGFEAFKENTLQDPRRTGVKGSMRSDIAIRLVYNGQDCIFHINSVDMKDAYNATDREHANFNRGVENARALLDHYLLAKGKWQERIAKMTLSERNALTMIPKPATDDEEEFQRIMKDFIKRLDCASIVAECEKGAGYMDTLPKQGTSLQ
ncbi:hypothetical protein [Dongia sp.]|uniref:hypothetical protein n=1 Tax=Dongia sp. TaxID=1977262 RepID=UPI0035B1553B